jgi:hypothetical protein
MCVRMDGTDVCTDGWDGCVYGWMGRMCVRMDEHRMGTVRVRVVRGVDSGDTLRSHGGLDGLRGTL